MTYQEFRPTGFRILPPIVKNLLIINLIFFLATITLQPSFGIDLIDILGLHYFQADKFNISQYITYMFLHGGFAHIFFNMFALWMFGNVLENFWGPKRFLIYYVVTGVGAALIHTVVLYFSINPVIQGIDNFLANPSIEKLQIFVSSHKFHVDKYLTNDMWLRFDQFRQNVALWGLNTDNFSVKSQVIQFMSDYREHFLNLPVVIGASGAVFGILLAFGMTFPNEYVYLYFALPIKAKYFVIGYAVLELWAGVVNRTGDNVAHFAHLGGMLFGLVLILLWRKRRFIK